jgi:hypothetical protein
MKICLKAKLLFCLLVLPTFVFGLEYSMGDSLTVVKQKNPGVIFTDSMLNGKPGFQFKTIEGEYLTTTDTQLIFDVKGRLKFVAMTIHGAALDVYEPLVDKYTKQFGSPKSSTPLTTNLKNNVTGGVCYWQVDTVSINLIIMIDLSGRSVPWVMLIEDREYNDY